MNKHELAKLEALAATVLEAELAKLEEISRRLSQARSEIDALRMAQESRAQELGKKPEGDLAFQTGQDARWALWRDGERIRLMRTVSKLFAEREEQILVARTAFGRRDALRKLCIRLEDDEKLRASRIFY